MTLQQARSFLFVPGDRPERFDKAAASGADAVILDLEDAVAPDRKKLARDAVSSWVRSAAGRKDIQLVVRCNAAGSPDHEDDLRCIAGLPASVGLMLAKAEPDATADLEPQRIGARPVIALIETVAGVLGVRAVATASGVVRIAFGNIDFALDAGIAPAPDEAELDTARAMLVLESRHANLPPPIDGVVQETTDIAQITEHAQRARRRGFGGRLCIHPRQVEAVNIAFTPSPEELAWAERVIAAFDASQGAAVALEGKMIDLPVVALARRLLAAARS